MDGLVFNIQRFSLDDGPGIRTTVFLKGCSLKCGWCHNPESIAPYPEIQFFRKNCTGCGDCIHVCPQNARRTAGGEIVFLRPLCGRCGMCVQGCHYNALKTAGVKMSPEEVLEEVNKDRAFYETSGGGVTISGGEPLLQCGFTKALLEACKKQTLRTALDTAGNVPWSSFEEVSDSVDLFLYDIKLFDEGRHIRATGAGSKQIKRNLEKLVDAGRNVWIRSRLFPE
jgi:pyruvate formate lyase activating enzyme